MQVQTQEKQARKKIREITQMYYKQSAFPGFDPQLYLIIDDRDY